MIDSRVEQVELFAWIGEDEHGSGEIGLKQALVAAGIIPMVAVKETKMTQTHIQAALQCQAVIHRKTIVLAKFKFDKILIRLTP